MSKWGLAAKTCPVKIGPQNGGFTET